MKIRFSGARCKRKPAPRPGASAGGYLARGMLRRGLRSEGERVHGLGAGDEARLRELLDKREIEEVLLRYCRGIDRMDRELVRSCYHPDATDEHGSFRGTVDEFLVWVWRVLGRTSMTMHFLGNVLVELEGDVARSEAYGISHHRSDSGEPTGNLIIGFRYIDRFERRGGAWRIARRVCTTEWVRVDDPAHHWPIPEGMRRGSRDRGDPVYERS